MLSREDKWKSETLDHVFNALALSPELSERLVYKGARVLRLLLNEITRASLDIDASFANIAANVSVSEEDLEHLRALASTAISTYFESQEPVRFVTGADSNCKQTQVRGTSKGMERILA